MESVKLRAREIVDGFAVVGKKNFTTAEMGEALGASPAATRLSLNRLATKGLITSTGRGFYTIVPTEYRSLSCTPPCHFIPVLMERLGQPYYAAILSAAKFHGAAHQVPQVFQVAVGAYRRPIVRGRVRIIFIVRRNIDEVPVKLVNTRYSAIKVSTEEATAFDVIGYRYRAGGINNVTTIVTELSEVIDPVLLASVAPIVPISWSQRLGYILEMVGAADKAFLLKAYVRRHARNRVILVPGSAIDQVWENDDWRLLVNYDVARYIQVGRKTEP